MVEQVLEDYRAAVYEKDAAAFADLYDQDARVFDLWGRWSYDGSDEWRGAAEEWFASLGDGRVGVEFDDVRTVVGDDVAVLHAFVTYRGLSAEGEQLRAMNDRVTWGLRRQPDGSWLIAHEHTSAPVEPETGKVTLQR